MDDDLPVHAFKVIDINQERWTMAAVVCQCGGGWSVGPQALIDVDGVPTDEFMVECGACGAAAVLRFDVSAFFEHQSRVAEWLGKLLPDAEERVRGRIARKVGPRSGRGSRAW